MDAWLAALDGVVSDVDATSTLPVTDAVPTTALP